MLENWFGEILLILILIFFICPQDIPKILRKIGKWMATLNKFQEQARGLRNELEESLGVDEFKKDIALPDLQKPFLNGKKGRGKFKSPYRNTNNKIIKRAKKKKGLLRKSNFIE